MRKRRALGMVDPIVANRFLLWSIWTGAITLQAAFTAVLRIAVWWSGAGEMLAQGLDPGGAWLAAIQAAKGVLVLVAPTAVISVYLAFSPPAGYRRWLQSRHCESSHA